MPIANKSLVQANETLQETIFLKMMGYKPENIDDIELVMGTISTVFYNNDFSMY